MPTSCVSRRQPFGNSGRSGRSIMRAISVAFSPARPSRLKNEPGIFPAAYMRSSTSTVSGRKSTSRRLPAVAVLRTTVSPERTTTAPEACLAIQPVSNEISVPPISTETRCTSGMCPSFLRPPIGGQALCIVSDASVVVACNGSRPKWRGASSSSARRASRGACWRSGSPPRAPRRCWPGARRSRCASWPSRSGSSGRWPTRCARTRSSRCSSPVTCWSAPSGRS